MEAQRDEETCLGHTSFCSSRDRGRGDILLPTQGSFPLASASPSQAGTPRKGRERNPCAACFSANPGPPRSTCSLPKCSDIPLAYKENEDQTSLFLPPTKHLAQVTKMKLISSPEIPFSQIMEAPVCYLTLSKCLTLLPTDPIPGCKAVPLLCKFGHHPSWKVLTR